MRRQKTVKIDNKEITIKELRVKDILDLYEGIGTEGIATIEDQAERFLPRVTDIALKDFKEMAPSEIQLLYDAFKEVNAVFFDATRSLGLDKFLKEVKSSILKDFSGLFAGLLGAGIAKPSNTDIPSSL